MQSNICRLKMKLKKKIAMECGKYSYNYNQTFTKESNFGSK